MNFIAKERNYMSSLFSIHSWYLFAMNLRLIEERVSDGNPLFVSAYLRRPVSSFVVQSYIYDFLFHFIIFDRLVNICNSEQLQKTGCWIWSRNMISQGYEKRN